MKRFRPFVLGALAALTASASLGQPSPGRSQAAQAQASPAPAAQDRWRWPAPSRVVVVADVHGAYGALVRLLEATAIVDAEAVWIGGDARLVSLGDLVDRGPDSRRVLELLMRLGREAAAAGGGVHVLLGNHEVMNVTGDLRYVSAAELAAFAAEELVPVREAEYREYRAERAAAGTDEDARNAFDARYPPGFFAHRAAFGPDGRYGRWLLTLPTLIVIGDTAFVHGGLPAALAEGSIGELNRRSRAGLRSYAAAQTERSTDAAEIATEVAERIADAPGIGVNGPLWYRGSAYCKPFLEEPVLDAVLAHIGAARAVVGHTPTEDRRVHALHDGKLIMLDTGMLAEYYAGRPAALIIDADGTHVQYLDPIERGVAELGRVEAYGLTREEILAALAQGDVVRTGDARGGESSQTVPVTVRFGGRTIEGRFYRGSRARDADRELAAFAVDSLLGLDLVPPTVERSVGGRNGALQLVYPREVSESQRMAQRVPLEAWCPLEPQVQLVHAFDLLIANVARSPDTVLFRPERPELKLVGHGEAFGPRALPAGLAAAALAVPQPLRDALGRLSAERLRQALAGRLDDRQIRALLERRDRLLEVSAR